MLYDGQNARVYATEEPDLSTEVLDCETAEKWGVVYYDVHERLGNQWLSAAQYAAPINDLAIREQASNAALNLAAGIETR